VKDPKLTFIKATA